jgi:hypothetical protein
MTEPKKNFGQSSVKRGPIVCNERNSRQQYRMWHMYKNYFESLDELL